MASQQNARLKVLFLPRWYPHRYDPMPGLFVRRQAEALSGLCDIAVLYVHPDHTALNKYEVDIAEEKGIYTIRVYFRTPSVKVAAVRGSMLLWRTLRAYRMGFRVLRNFRPDLIHVHVLTRVGVVALYRKMLTGVPYLITEHWSRYLPENDSYRGVIHKWLTKIVVRNSNGIIAVSETLKKAMKGCGLDHPFFKVVPNLVDTDQFTIKERKDGKWLKRILHISCFDDRSKNISGFLRTVKEISKLRNDFECVMVGEGPDLEAMKEYANNLQLHPDRVRFAGLLTGEDLVSELNTADLLVSSSHYETFGTVVIESLACGVPVVSTSTGIAPEVIHDDNGRLVVPGSEEDLKNAILAMLDNPVKADRQKIREEILQRFSMHNISQEMYQTYLQCLKR